MDITNLKININEILKAEIGALLFNLGKTNIGINFWKKYFPNGSTLFQGYSDYFSKKDKFSDKLYFYKELNEISEELEKFFKNLSIKIEKLFTPDSLTLIEILKGQKSNNGFVKNVFFYGCENVNSAIDKNFPNDKRIEPNLFLTNAFGSFKEKIKEENFDKTRKQFFEKLEKFLRKNNYFANPNWQKIRNFILKEIKGWYSHLLSDSRFPINDVTLFDQAYMTASMFKAVLAQLIMDNSKLSNYQDNPSTIKWRILGIQYDKMGLAEKGFKLASIKWYREITEKIDDEIKKLLEVEYPIGNEIYRDETGIYFIVGEDISELSTEIKNRILEIFKSTKLDERKEIEGLKGEIKFYVAISKASRGLMNLSTLLENAKENFLKTNTELIKFQKQELENKDTEFILKKDEKEVPKDCGKKDGKELNFAIGVCPICQVRLIFKSDKCKNNSPAICEVCDSRIHHAKVSLWIDNISGETIWTDEIKDKNNRIAYISIKFELEDWLSGDLLNTLLVNLGEDRWEKQKLYFKKYILEKLNEVNIDETFEFLKNCKDVNEVKNDILIIINNVNNIINNKKGEGNKVIERLKKDYIDKIFPLNEEIFNCSDIFSLVKVNHIILGLLNLLDKKKTEIEKIEGIENSISKKIYNSLDKIKCSSKSLKILIELSRNKFEKYEKRIFKIYPFSINPELKQYYYKYNSFRHFLEFIFFNNVENTLWEEFIKSQLSNLNAINFENRTITWHLLNDNDIEFLSVLLLQFLLRKNPSPARLRRIWETTREFFDNIHNDLDEKIISIPEWRKKRLVWEVSLNENNKLDKSRELESSGFLFWAEKVNNNKAKIYLISSIQDFIGKFRNENLLEELNKKQEEIDKNKVKQMLETLEISLKKYSEIKGKDEEKVLINISKSNLMDIDVIQYKPYSLITDTSPINYQVIIPAEYLSKFIDEVLQRYNQEFKYVYGKLPIHIGIVVSDYKKPVYVNLKALRKIRRDVRDTEKLWFLKEKKEFEKYFRYKKIYCGKEEERENNTDKYYSLFFDNQNQKDYQFYLKPDGNRQYWISTLSKFPPNSKVKLIPNTFDFEFMDTNTRRNDIYYDEIKHYKRALAIKSNRPYELEIYWEKFKKFKELFKDKVNTAKMHKLVSLFYEKLQNYDERFKSFLASAIINILELKKDNNAKKIISQIFDLDESSSDFQKELSEKLNEEKLKLFIDMFEFWHTALKEV